MEYGRGAERSCRFQRASLLAAELLSIGFASQATNAQQAAG
jgi:hypothetical protein